MIELAWRLLLPLRLYMRQEVVTAGRSQVWMVLAATLRRMPDKVFDAELPHGRRAQLRRHEVLGQHYLVFSGYEHDELVALTEYAHRDTVAIDVGANIGLMTIVLADAVGQDGRVWASEPVPANAERLRKNLAVNGIENVEIHVAAMGAREGEVKLNLANDPAYHSLGNVYEHRATGDQIEVPLISLDSMWQRAGRPRVSVVKIDTEGTEADVLAGGVELIEQCRPALLVELPGDAVADVLPVLRRYGYRLVPLTRLRSATKLFVADAVSR